MTRLILIRHGEAEHNRADRARGCTRFTGQMDLPLTEDGREQAAKLRTNSIFSSVDLIYSSDLSRAFETAQIIFPGRDIIADPLLRERSLGDFQGMTMDEIRTDPANAGYFRADGSPRIVDDETVRAPNGENYSDVCSRVAKFLEKIPNNVTTVAIASHVHVIRCFIMVVKHITFKEAIAVKIPNCGVTELDVSR